MAHLKTCMRNYISRYTSIYITLYQYNFKSPNIYEFMLKRSQTLKNRNT